MEEYLKKVIKEQYNIQNEEEWELFKEYAFKLIIPTTMGLTKCIFESEGKEVVLFTYSDLGYNLDIERDNEGEIILIKITKDKR